MTPRKRPVTEICRDAIVIFGVLLVSIAPARGAAPAGRYTVSAGTVYDMKTKLTWQQSVTPTTYTFSDATNYCAALSVTLGGAGWRLPTIKELQTIVDYSQADAPWIDRTAFPSTPVHYFWSATAEAGTTTHWVLDFSVGGIQLPGMSTSNNVRCVH